MQLDLLDLNSHFCTHLNWPGSKTDVWNDAIHSCDQRLVQIYSKLPNKVTVLYMRWVWFDLIYSICHGFDIDRQYVSVHSWCLISILADDDGDDVTVYGWSFLILLKYVFIINEVQCGVINYFSKPYLKLHIASDFWANLVLALRLWPNPPPPCERSESIENMIWS